VEGFLQRLEQDPALRQRLEGGTDEHLIACAHDLGCALENHDVGLIRHRMRLLQLSFANGSSAAADHALQQILLDLGDLPGPA
jgi:hypothetical protein